jgi:hypothetical protein
MTLPTMNFEEKSAGVEPPTYAVSSPAVTWMKKRGVEKKHVLIAVSVVVIIGLVIGAIIGGMYMFTEAQKEIVQFSLQFPSSNDGNVNQDVTSDPNDNVVMYHVTQPGQDVYVVNDFNKGLQVVKIATASSTNCYVSALNLTQAMDPSQITGPSSLTGSSGSNQQPYLVSNTPVQDTTFLTAKAATMCKGVSVYWAYRSCGGQNIDGLNVTKSITPDRRKRTIYSLTPFNGLPGLGGCCIYIFACQVYLVETVQGAFHTCQTYYSTGNCCNTVAAPYCNNVYQGTWQTPGLVC